MVLGLSSPLSSQGAHSPTWGFPVEPQGPSTSSSLSTRPVSLVIQSYFFSSLFCSCLRFAISFLSQLNFLNIEGTSVLSKLSHLITRLSFPKDTVFQPQSCVMASHPHRMSLLNALIGDEKLGKIGKKNPELQGHRHESLTCSLEEFQTHSANTYALCGV